MCLAGGGGYTPRSETSVTTAGDAAALTERGSLLGSARSASYAVPMAALQEVETLKSHLSSVTSKLLAAEAAKRMALQSLQVHGRVPPLSHLLGPPHTFSSVRQ
jgi:hypothetical protein